MSPAARTAFRIAAGGWLLGWFWKAWSWLGLLGGDALRAPAHLDGFSAAAQAPALALGIYLAPLPALAALVRPTRARALAAALAMTACALAATLHPLTAPDATFTTSFWAGLWLCWLAWHAGRDDDAFRTRAALLARCVVALVFLGGVAGKLTPEYAGGDAFHQLYFLGKSEWPYPALRERLDPETLRALATWFSRAAITGELLMVALPLLPLRLAAWAGCALMLGMVLVSTWMLFSVMACLIALLVAARALSGRPPRA